MPTNDSAITAPSPVAEFFTLETFSPGELADKLGPWIRGGWEPVGNPFVVPFINGQGEGRFFFSMSRGGMQEDVRAMICLLLKHNHADHQAAAEANRDRPWESDGPSVEEAGGESILVRVGDDLVRAEWSPGFGLIVRFGAVPPEDLLRARRGGWHDGIGWLEGERAPTGWRPMPKVNGE